MISTLPFALDSQVPGVRGWVSGVEYWVFGVRYSVFGVGVQKNNHRSRMRQALTALARAFPGSFPEKE
jgi:hypothetical protein